MFSCLFHLSICLFCLSVCLFVCLSVCVSFCVSVCVYVCICACVTFSCSGEKGGWEMFKGTKFLLYKILTELSIVSVHEDLLFVLRRYC